MMIGKMVITYSRLIKTRHAHDKMDKEFQPICLFVADDRYDVLRGDHAGGAHELRGGSAGHPPP